MNDTTANRTFVSECKRIQSRLEILDDQFVMYREMPNFCEEGASEADVRSARQMVAVLDKLLVDYFGIDDDLMEDVDANTL